jgi:hypothetical protein
MAERGARRIVRECVNRSALFLFAALAASGCTQAAPAPAPAPAPPPATAAVEEPLPAHWRGAFTMVQVPSGMAATRQFQLVLGRDGPNAFTARRGC